MWLINAHNGIKESGLKPILITEYPAVKEHLDKFIKQLQIRTDKGDTPYNLRNCAYMEDFNRQKIVWGNLNLSASYTIAPEGLFINAPCPIIVPGNKYILAFLNSKISDYYIRQLGVTRNGGYFEYKPMFIERLPVPFLTQLEQDRIIVLVDKVLELKTKNISSKDVEYQIDELIYSSYKLNSEEIKFIEELGT